MCIDGLFDGSDESDLKEDMMKIVSLILYFCLLCLQYNIFCQVKLLANRMEFLEAENIRITQQASQKATQKATSPSSTGTQRHGLLVVQPTTFGSSSCSSVSSSYLTPAGAKFNVEFVDVEQTEEERQEEVEAGEDYNG